MSTLIDLLNGLSNQTPDEIVTALQKTPLGWVLLTEITPQQYERMFMRQCILTTKEPGANRWIVQGRRDNWEFWFSMEDCQDWPDSYIKLLEEYEHGEPLPD